MANTKIVKSFSPKSKEIRYLAKSFPEWRSNLIDFARVYFPDTYNDFNESSPGMMFIEMASVVGDVLSYYIDSQFKENLIQHAEERENIISIAQSLGYRTKPATASNTIAEIFQVVPALAEVDNFAPDERYFLKIAPNMTVSSGEFGKVLFRTTEEVNFADPYERELIVYTINDLNQPLTYLAKKPVRLSSGEVKTYDISFTAAQKFSKALLPDENVLEVLKVVDSNGNLWYETDYLAQDLILDDRENATPSTISTEGTPPQYLVKLRRAPRRFVTRYNADFKLELHFGSGVLDDSDELISLDARKIASDEYRSRLASTTLDPSDFLSSNSYGLAPSNTDLTITYVVGGGIESNVPTNTITTVVSREIKNDTSGLNASELGLFNSIIRTLAINNPEAASGGKGADSIEEIRQNALGHFNSQNRAVNSRDYIARVYSMPPRFGAVAKAFVIQDEQISKIMQNQIFAGDEGQFVINSVNPNAINLYTLGYDNNKKLKKLNIQTKENLKIYLDQYRMLTDQVSILDAFIINIGVNFKIVTFKNENMNEVLARCIDAIKDFFDIDRWQINQPIVINDLHSQILQVEGVQSIVHLEIVNKYRHLHGSDYEEFIYDISAATDVTAGIIYASLDPSLFEIRHPDSDIVGSAIS